MNALLSHLEVNTGVPPDTIANAIRSATSAAGLIGELAASAKTSWPVKQDLEERFAAGLLGEVNRYRAELNLPALT